MTDEFPTRLVTGIQPTSSVHLGQYFGAVETALDLHDNFAGDCFYFIADYHALTRSWSGTNLRARSAHVTRAYLALGLDPERACLYRQSDVPEACELMWILSCVTGKGALDRAVVYKSMLEEGLEPTVGLYMYPELQAADVLGLRSTWVPAGRNQTQNIEMAREIARRANNSLNRRIFPEPRLIESQAPKVPGTDGLSEMNASRNNIIPIFGSEAEVRSAIRSIRTADIPVGEPIPVEGDLLLEFLRLLSGPSSGSDTSASYNYVRTGFECGTVGFSEAKEILCDAVLELFSIAREFYFSSQPDDDSLEEILSLGAKQARREFQSTLEIVRDAVGFGPYARGGTAR